MNKKQRRAQQIGELVPILQCPLCGQSMSLMQSKSVLCTQKHTFDITRQGYVNFVPQAVKSNYTKQLFEARRAVVNDGFYDPLIQKIQEVIVNECITSPDKQIRILDSGCGEGSHLMRVCNLVQQSLKKEEFTVQGIGIDLAKEGIMTAAKNHDGGIWFVADLAKSPFMDRSFDVMLNILSPSNYREFHRLLKSDGIVIKVVPGVNYLKELRFKLYEGETKQHFTNEKTVSYFYKHYDVVKRSMIQYTRKLNASQRLSLLEMTPLGWSAAEDKARQFQTEDSLEVTVDLELLVGIGSKITRADK